MYEPISTATELVITIMCGLSALGVFLYTQTTMGVYVVKIIQSILG